MAAVGEILISEQFLEQLKTRPDVEGLGLSKLKGKATDTVVYRVKW